MKGGKAIWAAYDDCNALAIQCPNCCAPKGNWCTKDDGRVRRVPCVSRAAAGGFIVADTRRHRDFSEPTHQRKEEQP